MWSPVQNSRMLNLFKLKYKIKGGVNLIDLPPENIKQTIAKQFPERSYGNFALLFRLKTRDLNVHRSVEGVRKAKSKLMFLLHLMSLLTIILWKP